MILLYPFPCRLCSFNWRNIFDFQSSVMTSMKGGDYFNWFVLASNQLSEKRRRRKTIRWDNETNSATNTRDGKIKKKREQKGENNSVLTVLLQIVFKFNRGRCFLRKHSAKLTFHPKTFSPHLIDWQFFSQSRFFHSSKFDHRWYSDLIVVRSKHEIFQWKLRVNMWNWITDLCWSMKILFVRLLNIRFVDRAW